MASTNNIMELRAIPDLLNKKYYIPEYQRGYRWEEKQVLDLLEDLNAFFSGTTTGDFYCLQPIVVKEKTLENETWYEVIDGQQRLTTLRLIMQVFDQLNSSKFGPVSHHEYTIRYATRPQMEPIFNSIQIQLDATGNATIDDSKNTWQNFIDSIYIYNAAKTILQWFIKIPSRINTYGLHFYKTIIEPKRICVVWYETVEKKDPHDIFNRMNSLKVDLSCSELIRSLFLSSGTKFDLGNDLNGLSPSLQEEIRKERFEHKQTSINEKWDELEQQMRDYAFQSFITRRNDTGRNAIGLLFDLMSGKYADNKVVTCPFPNLYKDDSLYTYLFFKSMIERDGDAWITWQKVLSAFEKLRHWYHDRDLFHRIGFLNAVSQSGREDDAVCQLLEFTGGKNALHQKVIDLIKAEMTLPIDKKRPISKLEQLSYDNTPHYNYIKKLLLLYNVETCRQQTSEEYFSFNKYRYKDDSNKVSKKENVWTLEHIHAQNSDCLPKDNKNSWHEWIIVNLDALTKLTFGDPTLEKARLIVVGILQRDSAISPTSSIPVCLTNKYTYDNIKSVFDDVANFYEMLDSTANKATPVHQLSNMTLLNLEQNAMIGKSPFEVKRQLISKQIVANDYYPICTKKVFMKLYDTDSIQIHSWSQKDRMNYYNDIAAKIKQYIDPAAL